MLVTPILIGLLNAACFGTSDYLSKDVIGRIGYFKTTVYVLLLSGAGVLLTAPLLGLSFEIAGTMIGLLVLVSVANFFGFIFMYRGFQTGLLSVVSPLVNSFPAITTVISLLLFGGSLSPTTAVTLSVIVVGVVLVSTRLSELGGHLKGSAGRLSVGAGSGLIAALLFGGPDSREFPDGCS
ncbi:MAG: DMT family transporter [Thaumarchaeota archaeon]|nr:DMT family transporter [Nitrososphaerota archaeon]